MSEVWSEFVDGASWLQKQRRGSGLGLAESDARPITGSVVRGKYPSAIRIKRQGDREMILEYVFQIDFGGALPAWLTNSYMASTAGAVTEAQEYFQALRDLEEWDEDDGRVVAEVLCIKIEAEKDRGLVCVAESSAQGLD